MEQGAAQHGPVGPEPPEPGRSSRRSALAAGAVLAVIAVAVAAYFLGRASADLAGAERRGFERGRALGQGRFAPGRPGYQAIYRAGHEAGFRSGRAAGIRVGQRQGERVGAERGRRAVLDQGAADIGQLAGSQAANAAAAGAALGGFASWQTDTFYVVRLAGGEQGVPYRIAARIEMADDQRYAVCARTPSDVCLEPIPGR